MLYTLLSLLNRLVLFKQSLFSLSWFVAVLLMAMYESSAAITLQQGLYGFLAFFAARTSGMCFNRLIDKNIDAENPRTEDRPLCRGEISEEIVRYEAWGCLLLFLVFAYLLGPHTFILATAISLLLCIYSYTKRFTTLCHFVLGIIYFLAALAFWTLVEQEIGRTAYFMALALGVSITAGDILYACQDAVFDKTHGLKSIPAWLGVPAACRMAQVLHALTLFLLLQAGMPLAATAVGIVYVFAHKKVEEGQFEAGFIFANTYSGMSVLLVTLTIYLCRVL